MIILNSWLQKELNVIHGHVCHTNRMEGCTWSWSSHGWFMYRFCMGHRDDKQTFQILQSESLTPSSLKKSSLLTYETCLPLAHEINKSPLLKESMKDDLMISVLYGVDITLTRNDFIGIARLKVGLK